MNRKQVMAITFVSVLLFSALAGTQFVNLGRANPYSQAVYKGEISPPSKPIITISSTKNNTSYSTNGLSIILNVSIRKTNKQNYYEFISRVYYKSDWLQDDTFVYEYYNPDPNYIRPRITEFYYRLNLTGIPEGKHNITFYAIEAGYYFPSLFEYYGFSANVSSVLLFTIDTTPPIISALSVENKTYYTSDVALNFIVNEPVSQVTYSLDRQTNVTLTGNTTLTDLSDGPHTLTVYARDTAENTGASETVYFSIAQQSESQEPPPNDSADQTNPDLTPFSIAVPIVLAIIVSLAFYGRKKNVSLDSPTARAKIKVNLVRDCL